MTPRVLKWTIHVDDRPHLVGAGPVLMVQPIHGRHDVLEVWTLEESDAPEVEPTRFVQAFATGQPVTYDREAQRPHIGSVKVGLGLVWHVFQVVVQ